MSEEQYWIWLSSLPGLRKETARRLTEEYGSPRDVYFAPQRETDLAPYLRESEKRALRSKELSHAHETAEKCEKLGIRVVALWDAVFPQRLSNIPEPPLVLYVRGTLPPVDDEPVVGIAGTRRCSAYGAVTAGKLAADFARCGGTVVSGLAKGIDAAAAEGALNAGGKVIGVSGCGIDTVYPRENESLFTRVAENGAVVSEYPPGAPPARQNFPARNRIISGLSLGVVIVEAPEGSGALITADWALQQGRDVFAVPGNVDRPTFAGSNRLIGEGAKLISCAEDLLEEYLPLFPERLQPPETSEIGGISPPVSAKSEDFSVGSAKKSVDKSGNAEYIDLSMSRMELDENEKTVLSLLGSEPRHVDDLALDCGLPPHRVLAALTKLELLGVAGQRPGKLFYLNSSEERGR